eukprot:CAMPEP_0197532480 /NCGR_PEP_ID=MMETSP1318-20131121/39869_1 /TAXON_ID=552666 /ORGANISM="Partenskyella glossopodia, Strain RCC365" /LENGTH=649 /DNA_ID=CAMNT_0043089051 /DNA_START=50 /DNA_END=1997 /DNA_ORIENTATION=+
MHRAGLPVWSSCIGIRFARVRARVRGRICSLRALSTRADAKDTSSGDKGGGTAAADSATPKPNEFRLWKDLYQKDEAKRVKLAAFLTEFSEMVSARSKMVESPSLLKKRGLSLHDQLDPTSVRRLIEYLRESRGLITMSTFHNILHQAFALINCDPNITFIDNPQKEGSKVTVVGDLHGDLDDLIKILDYTGMPSEENVLVFNGDFVDRGQHGVEVLAVLLALKVVFPKCVFLNRGNHEDGSICRAYGFYDEVMAKYSSPGLYEEITNVFASLPLCAIIRDRAFIVHGGIPRMDGTTIHHIGAIARRTHKQTFCTSSERDKGRTGAQTSRQVIEDMMWSDPDPYTQGFAASTSRGAGCRYGPDTVKRWLRSLGSDRMKTLVRSHECVEEGHQMIDCGEGFKVWTIFSASNYADGWNKGGILVFNHGDTDPEVYTYETSFQGNHNQKQNAQHKRIVELICVYQAPLAKEFEKLADKNDMITVKQWEDAILLELGLSLDYTVFSAQSAIALGLEDDKKNSALESSMIKYQEFFEECKSQISSVHQHSQALSAIFGLLDENGDGVVTYEEFRKGCELLNHRLPHDQQFDAQNLFRMIDSDRSGIVELHELNEVLKGTTLTTLQEGGLGGLDLTTSSEELCIACYTLRVATLR